MRTVVQAANRIDKKMALNNFNLESLPDETKFRIVILNIASILRIWRNESQTYVERKKCVFISCLWNRDTTAIKRPDIKLKVCYKRSFECAILCSDKGKKRCKWPFNTQGFLALNRLDYPRSIPALCPILNML